MVSCLHQFLSQLQGGAGLAGLRAGFLHCLLALLAQQVCSVPETSSCSRQSLLRLD